MLAATGISSQMSLDPRPPNGAASLNIPRLILAFLIAPLAPGALFATLLMFIVALSPGSKLFSQAGAHLFFTPLMGAALSAGLGYPIALILGIPAFLLLVWFRATTRITFTVAAAALGIFAYPCFWLLCSLMPSNQLIQHYDIAPALCLGAASGAIAGLTFWYLIRPMIEEPN
jgi:hypothetical protein